MACSQRQIGRPGPPHWDMSHLAAWRMRVSQLWTEGNISLSVVTGEVMRSRTPLWWRRNRERGRGPPGGTVQFWISCCLRSEPLFLRAMALFGSCKQTPTLHHACAFATSMAPHSSVFLLSFLDVFLYMPPLVSLFSPFYFPLSLSSAL
jgi:hypothetical protein